MGERYTLNHWIKFGLKPENIPNDKKAKERLQCNIDFIIGYTKVNISQSFPRATLGNLASPHQLMMPQCVLEKGLRQYIVPFHPCNQLLSVQCSALS